MLTFSKHALTRKWLSKEPPTQGDWIGIIKEIYKMEKLTISLN